MVEQEKKELDLSNRLNVLRAGVLGANDGIVSVAGVVIGVAAAGAQNTTILIAGIAALLAGAFSMAGGEYVSVSTQADTEKATVAQQERNLRDNFAMEKRLVCEHYLAQGISRPLAEAIATEIMEKDALAITIQQKYGLEIGEYTNPWHAAISSFFSFTLGALLPLVAIALLPIPAKIIGTVIAVVIALFLTGFSSARLGNAPWRPAVLRNVTAGLLTMIVTYVIGLLLHTQNL